MITITNCDSLSEVRQKLIDGEEVRTARHLELEPLTDKEQSCKFLEENYIALDMAIKALEQESCEYYALCRHGRDENKLRVRLGVCEYCNEDSDGYVKPIEKNNHAFVRFGMNGWELSLKANGWHGSAKIRYCPMCGRDLFVK